MADIVIIDIYKQNYPALPCVASPGSCVWEQICDQNKSTGPRNPTGVCNFCRRKE